MVDYQYQQFRPWSAGKHLESRTSKLLATSLYWVRVHPELLDSEMDQGLKELLVAMIVLLLLLKSLFRRRSILMHFVAIVNV